MTLEELLKELVKADPERFQYRIDGYVGRIDENWGTIPLDKKRQDALTFAVIELMLRQAIEARGWEWSISTDGDNRIAQVEIYKPYTTPHTWLWWRTETETHPIPAIALGMAYLKALGGVA